MQIRPTHAAFAVGACLLGLTAYGVGCSVPDRTFYDDTAGNGDSGGSAGSAASGGVAKAGAPSNNAGADDGGTMGDAGESPGGAAGTTGTAGNPGDVRPVPSRGLIVIGGTDLDQVKGLISVIAPASGKELARDTLPQTAQVAGIAYDGADQKDVWYVFVGADFPAKPDKVVDLQVRYFDDTSDKWITLSKLTTLPPPVPGTLTVLNNRVAYLSHVVSGATTVPALTILDTTDVKAVKTIASAYTPATAFVGNMVTLIGTRGTAADATGVGGTLDLGLQQTCDKNKVCQLFVQPIPVGDTIGSALGHVLGSYQGKPVAYASQLDQLDFFALSPAAGNVKVYRATPNAPESADSFDAPQSANDLSGMTVAECQKTALVTADSENALYGVTLNAGAGVNFDLGRAGQLVAYEPFTRGVIATYNPSSNDFQTAPADAGVVGPEITAVDVTSTGGATLKLVERTKLWSPPTDLRANVLVTRFPVPFKCAQ